jgi:hypothetical protein
MYTSQILFKAKRVALTEERRNTCRTVVRKHEGRRPLEDVGIDGVIILKRLLKEKDGTAWTGLT